MSTEKQNTQTRGLKKETHNTSQQCVGAVAHNSISAEALAQLRELKVIQNEKGQLIAKTTFENFTDVYACSKCFRLFDIPGNMEFHAKSCQPIFTRTIAQKENLQIACVGPNSPYSERRICERISEISMLASGWSAPVLREGAWDTPEMQSRAFLLIYGTSIAGYIVVSSTRTMEEGGLRQQPLISDMFIAQGFRRKGFMKFLLLESLKVIHERLDTVALIEPITEAGEKFLEAVAKELKTTFQTYDAPASAFHTLAKRE